MDKHAALNKLAEGINKVAAEPFIASGRAYNPYINIGAASPEAYNRALFNSQWSESSREGFPFTGVNLQRMNWNLEKDNPANRLNDTVMWNGARGTQSGPFSRDKAIRWGYRLREPLDKINKDVTRGDAQYGNLNKIK